MEIYDQCHANKIVVYVLLLSMLNGYSFAEEPSEETSKLLAYEEMPIRLNIIANEIRTNYEQIHTWSGAIDISLRMLHVGNMAKSTFKYTDGTQEIPNAILQKAKEKSKFSIDLKNNFIRIDNFREKNQYFNYVTGVDLGSKSAHHIQSISVFRPDFFLKSKPDSYDIKEYKVIRRRAVKKPPSPQESRTGLYQGNAYDPRRIFMPGSILPWDHFNSLIKKIDKFGKIEFDGYSLKMEERIKGDITEYKLIQPSIISLERSDPNHYIIQTKIFSSQCDFNMTYCEVTSGSGMLLQKFTCEYELIDGVYLPKRTVEKRCNSKGEISFEMHCTYIHNELNQEIPADTFEYVNLNLKEGDRFIDKISNKEYRYEENTQTLKPIEK